MAQPRLRVYFGPQDSEAPSTVGTLPQDRHDRVTVPLGEIFPLLADAIQSERT